MFYDYFLYALFLLFAYLMGSIPYGLVLVSWAGGPDLRTFGSKNIGATNVLRAGYKRLAILTVIFDAGKGAFAMYLAYLFVPNSFLYLFCGLFAVLGHVFPVWLGFKGGKGVATIFGVLLFANPIAFAFTCITWFFVAITFRYSSLSAMVSLVMAPIYIYIFSDSLVPVYVIALVSLLSLYRHKTNIIRLLKGEESKIKFKK